MKIRLLTIICSIVVNSASGETINPGAYSAHPSPQSPPAVTTQPFFPADDQCWNVDDKFSHPKEMTAPRFSYFFYPSPSQEATILVQVNEYGYPLRLSVVASNSERVTNMMLSALAKARWWTEPNKNGRLATWFLYKMFSDKNGWHLAT